MRTLEQQSALDLFDGRLVTARLRGFVFFGSANSLGLKLHQVGGRAGERQQAGRNAHGLLPCLLRLLCLLRRPLHARFLRLGLGTENMLLLSPWDHSRP